MRTLAALAIAFAPIAAAQEAAPANSPGTSPLETLREHWDAEIITGEMVDEIKKVLDEGDAETIAPLLRRIELLGREGEAYAPDFALWWDMRGRTEIGGKTFWRRDLVREALNGAIAQHDQAKLMRLLSEAAETGDPVARMWLLFAQKEMGRRDDAESAREWFSLADEVKELANAGDPEASLLMVIGADEGDLDHIQPGSQEMIQWLETAAKAEYFMAERMLADVYAEGKYGLSRDAAKAQEWSSRVRDRNPDAYAAQLRASSSNNLKQMGLVGKMYANESAGEKWPALSSEPGQLAMNADEVYPEYLTDPTILISPAHPDAERLKSDVAQDPKSVMGDHSYWYLGYAIRSEEEMLAFVNAVRDAAVAGKALTEDIDSADVERGEILRLREGVERLYITDINDPQASSNVQSKIPVMIERPGLHDIGANVLFLDGHTEFLRYPSHFPMTEKVIEALESLDDVKDQH